MAITLADFNKIWSSTSPLSPYTFSDDDYNEGWNFIGQIPPSRQMWDFLQKNNDEKMQYLANNYLPLSGGTMTGAIKYSGNKTAIQNDVDNGFIELLGGKGYQHGGRIILRGKDNYGDFIIQAHDGVNEVGLQGKPNGTLTWGGSDILTALNGVNSYTKVGSNPSLTVFSGQYLLFAYTVGYSVPSSSIYYVGILGGSDYNDGTPHIGVLDIIKGTDYASLGLSYTITADGTNRITVSLTNNLTSHLMLLKLNH